MSFMLEFDPDTLELLRLRAMDPKRGVLTSPSDPAVPSGALITVIKAKDEASLRRHSDFKGIALVSRAETEAMWEMFEHVIDTLPDPQERRAMQLCLSRKSPKHTVEETAAEMGCDEGLVCWALSNVYMGVARRESQLQASIR